MHWRRNVRGATSEGLSGMEGQYVAESIRLQSTGPVASIFTRALFACLAAYTLLLLCLERPPTTNPI